MCGVGYEKLKTDWHETIISVCGMESSMFRDNLEERYELAVERIKQIREEGNSYFKAVADFIMTVIEVYEEKNRYKDSYFADKTKEELAEINERLYRDVAGDNYEKSYANPAFAVSQFGVDTGRLLSFLYVEVRGIIAYAYEDNKANLTAVLELFIEIYCLFDDEDVQYKTLKEAVYWYVSDYSDDFVEQRVREQLDADCSFATDIIMDSDLSDIRYLYSFGEYITDNEIKTAEYLNSLSEDRIKAMASTFTEGYRKGFELGNKDISKKKTVNIRYSLGFERVVREEIKQFKQMGLDTTIYRAAVNTINKRMHIKVGFFGTSPNRQMDYDHRFDNALYLDSAFVERKLGALKLAYENNRELAGVFGGPAVMEIFGEEPFEPIEKAECLKLDEKQRRLSVKYDNESSAIINTYIKGEERSFTIIAYPVPEIGADYESIFDDTVRINTLDYEQYEIIQQTIIDVLDKSDYVSVKGRNGNCTDINVKLMKVEDADTQTIFENCLADVNIPLGEVFTSPVLKGTNGVLNVSRVYLNDLKFDNLKVNFSDGMVTSYSCDNFDDDEKNKAFFKENVLYNHETLPIGEFAIGTNTTAYVMANKYDIVYKLPILIVEKMGPHFALGDTCYSHSEQVKVYNPNKKEIISKDNEISILRETDADKAYFNCHTDITIPYEEIGSITAFAYDGSFTEIIKEGRFVLKGCEALNEPFNELAN